MTHPMVEKVARAICDDQLWPGAWIKANEVEMDAYKRQARAAIAAVLDAMREPSEGMKHSGTEFLYGEDFIGNPKAVTTAVETWRAMIDALRAELLPPPGDA